MQHRRATKNGLVLFITVLFSLLIVIDRYYRAQISQWREDQAANLWLGYTAGIGHVSVGLISSKYIPNPNGMILVGSILSFLPDLLTVSLFLRLARALLLGLSVGKPRRVAGNVLYWRPSPLSPG